MTDAPRLSAVILAFDEEINIERAVKSALRAARDVVVVDSGSRDRTVELARKAGARVLHNEWRGTAAQRNWALDHAGLSGDWVLFLDADEVVTPEFAEALSALLRDRPELDGVALCRRFHWWGRWVPSASAYPCFIDRVARVGMVRFRVLGHGEVFEGGECFERLSEPLHDEDLKPIGAWFERHNRYARQEAQAVLEGASSADGRVDSARRIRARLRRMPGWPVLAFVYYLTWRRGLFQGREGRTYCAMKALYEYMVQLHLRDVESRRARGLPVTPRRD